MTTAEKYTRDMKALYEKGDVTVEALKAISTKYPIVSTDRQIATFNDGSKAEWFDEHNLWRVMPNALPKCYRSVCASPHDSCKHTQTGKLYCEECAIKINRNNPEVPNLVAIPAKIYATGVAVIATPMADDVFSEEFTGSIVSMRRDDDRRRLFTVADQDDHEYEVYASQLKLVEI